MTPRTSFSLYCDAMNPILRSSAMRIHPVSFYMQLDCVTASNLAYWCVGDLVEDLRKWPMISPLAVSHNYPLSSSGVEWRSLSIIETNLVRHTACPLNKLEVFVWVLS